MVEQLSQEEIMSKMEKSRQIREESQAKRLKVAYDRMIAFEKERKNDREERSMLNRLNNQMKTRSFASNF